MTFWYLLTGMLPLRQSLGERSTAPIPMALLTALLDSGAEPFEIGVFRFEACVFPVLDCLRIERSGSWALLFLSTLIAAVGEAELRPSTGSRDRSSGSTLSRLRTALGALWV